MTIKSEICNAFNAHAFEYEKAARVQKEIGERLFERLDMLTISPRYILDLGCGTGFFTKKLRKRYPNACIVGLDIAPLMLKQAQKTQRYFKTWSLVQADMLSMPFPAGLFDLVFANQVLHWGEALTGGMRELNRIMNANGCLMFTTLGPDTFRELRDAWRTVNHYAHANAFMDMHELGDILLAEHFIDPVVDMEILEVHYASLSKLLGALKAQGVRNIHPNRNPGLTGRHGFGRFEAEMTKFCTEQGQFPLTYEVVYGHAWKGLLNRTTEGTETLFPISQLLRKR
jgi:malonyl-CoA O-methyltransferase